MGVIFQESWLGITALLEGMTEKGGTGAAGGYEGWKIHNQKVFLPVE